MSDTSAIARQSSDPDRRFPVRRVDFDQTMAALQRDFVTHGDVLLSHLVAALSGVFPDGEDMFVESVKHYRDEITDLDLRQQVNAFIGQESVHGRQHRALNDRLAELGYRSKLVEQLVSQEDAEPLPPIIVKAMIRLGILRPEMFDDDMEPSPLFQLALTAALEHYTATMAELLLTDDTLQAQFADQDFFGMWAWHALEESEHKTVAFDVFRAVGGDEDTRRRAMKLAGVSLVFIVGGQTIAGVIRDRRAWRRGPGNLLASLRRFRRNPLLSTRFRARLKDYYRDDFHPLDHDSAELEAAWRAWFDEGGERPQFATAA